MSDKKLCDICKKEIYGKWFEVKQVYKEMNYGMHMDEGTYDICSKECLLELAKKIRELD